MATRLEKVKKIFRRFDVDSNGLLGRNEMAALVLAANPRVRFAAEQINVILDEFFRNYAPLGDPHISVDDLLRAYNDGAGDVDRDFDTLGLSLEDGDHAISDSIAYAAAVSPTSTAQLPPLPPRPRQLVEEVENPVRRQPHQAGDGPVPSGAPPRPSYAWDRRSSSSSSLASSSFCSEWEDAELDYRDRPVQSELEEIPSFRWLSPSLMPRRPPAHRPEPSQSSYKNKKNSILNRRTLRIPGVSVYRRSIEVDWVRLSFDRPTMMDKDVRDGIAERNWMILGLDEQSGWKCALIPARGLDIRWRDRSGGCWRYDGVVAVLFEVRWLDIQARVNAADLSPGTPYVCLLVFDLSPLAIGLGGGGETQKASVFLGPLCVSDRAVRLQPASDRKGGDGAREPRQRRDGWMEMELGEFSVRESHGSDAVAAVVSMTLMEVERLSQPKGGLVVRGVEVRPRQFSHKELTRFNSWQG